MRLYPVKTEEEAEKASKRGTGRKNVRLYPAKAGEEAERVVKRGTERENRHLCPARAKGRPDSGNSYCTLGMKIVV